MDLQGLIDFIARMREYAPEKHPELAGKSKDEVLRFMLTDIAADLAIAAGRILEAAKPLSRGEPLKARWFDQELTLAQIAILRLTELRGRSAIQLIEGCKRNVK